MVLMKILCNPSIKGPFHPNMLVTLGTASTNKDMITQGNKMQANDKKCLRELHGALPLVVYNYVHGCSIVKQI